MSQFLNPSTSVNAAGTATKRMWHGIYTASVVSTQDPLKKSRVTLKVPQVLGTSSSNWAVPIGFEPVIPAVNQIVWAMFLGGDINHPLYMYASTTSISTSVPGVPTVKSIDGATLTGSTLASPVITTPAITGGTYSSPAITTPTVTGGTLTSPTITTPSISTPTISSPVITGGTISSPTISSPTISNPTITGLSALNAGQVLVNGATGTAALEVAGDSNLQGIVEAQQILVNGSSSSAALGVAGSMSLTGTIATAGINVNGATGSATVAVNGSVHVEGNFVADQMNGQTLPATTVSKVTTAAPATYTATTQGIITALETAVNDLISRLQSVGIIS